MVNFYSILLGIVTFALISDSSESDWTESSPGIAMDYRIHIDAGKEDCYYQHVHSGSTIFTSVNVLKGGDGKAGLTIRNPQNLVVLPYDWKSNFDFEEVSQTGGYYAICIDNQFSKFSDKLINLYITTFRPDLWEKYTAELEQTEIHVANFTESLRWVDTRINMMLQQQAQSRAREARDFQLMIDNHNWIFLWSLGLCIALVVTSVTQVFVIRKLLSGTGAGSSNAKAGPRA
ncbi:GOLD domain [Trinorchestia longiramus]|nr:GOLD domain [Trinorchestia longiramus]